jgi:hypothetical protein
MRIELSCYRKRQFIGNCIEIVSGRTVVGGGLKEDGWKPDNFVVGSSVCIVHFIVEFCGVNLTYLFLTLMVVNHCWYYLTICR